MKICVVSDAYYPYPSGVSEYAFYLARYLRKFGHTVEILTTHYPREQPEEGVRRVGRVFLIPMNKSYATLSTGWQIPRYVKDLMRTGRFDIVHLNGPFPPSISFFALHYSTAVNIAAYLSTGFKFRRSGARLFRTAFAKYNDKIAGSIALSRAARETFAPYFPGDYRVIPCGVDTEVFNPGIGPRREFAGSQNRVLYLGRLDRRKGLQNLLLAFRKIIDAVKDARLIVVGKGPMADEAVKLTRALGIGGSVVFKGYASAGEIPSYYASSDVYCSPALGGESFGIVLLEAMAMSRPVVASNIPGYNEVVRHGENGLLFDPGNIDAIADSIIRVLADPTLRKKLAANGYRFAQEHSWEKIARRIEALYREKLGRDS